MEKSFDDPYLENNLDDLYGSTIYHLFDRDIREASSAKLIDDFLEEYSTNKHLISDSSIETVDFFKFGGTR